MKVEHIIGIAVLFVPAYLLARWAERKLWPETAKQS